MRKVLAAALGACVVTLVSPESRPRLTSTPEAQKASQSSPRTRGTGPGGNVACPANTIVGPKLDPGSNYSDANLTVSGYDGHTFDWAFTACGIRRVRHGDRDREGRAELSRLHVRLHVDRIRRQRQRPVRADNPKNGKDYGVSHIQFCFDPKGGGDN